MNPHHQPEISEYDEDSELAMAISLSLKTDNEDNLCDQKQENFDGTEREGVNSIQQSTYLSLGARPKTKQTSHQVKTLVIFQVSADHKQKYDNLFDKLGPQAGRLSEEKVGKFLKMLFELPDSTLGKIMELSDQEKDGTLDTYEFTVAFHLADRAYSDYQIPDQVVICISS